MKEKILADRYRLTEQIGMGGMAIVYKAIDLRTGHNVAVKVLRPEFNEDSEFIGRFQREAEAASKMTHHNIVNLLDVGMDGDNRYLVMEYVQGKTLKDVIQEREGFLHRLLARLQYVSSAHWSMLTETELCTGTSSRRIFLSMRTGILRWQTLELPELLTVQP